MLYQQYFALILIIFFVFRLFWQKKKKQIASGEFLFWLIFWLITTIAVVSLKEIDRIVAVLGFSGSGIEILLYIAVAFMFYLIFRMRLRILRLEKDITAITREIAINKD